ncbi:unnamed protein product [Amoebophrya sp. A25]|nr:unnamed protein product [Amoebophrya sp. A25]|eukprot:GSA25T00023129001.1
MAKKTTLGRRPKHKRKTPGDKLQDSSSSSKTREDDHFHLQSSQQSSEMKHEDLHRRPPTDSDRQNSQRHWDHRLGEEYGFFQSLATDLAAELRLYMQAHSMQFLYRTASSQLVSFVDGHGSFLISAIFSALHHANGHFTTQRGK